jgi:ParB family chromosome partitioning protein
METAVKTPVADNFHLLPIAQVGPGPWNPRKHKDPARQAELEASVRLHGVIQPIVVRPSGAAKGAAYLIVAGDRRFAAAVTVGLPSIPAMVRDTLSDAQCQEIACLENLNRHDLHPLDEAEAFARLRKVDRAYTDDALAAKFGKPVAYVRRRLSLLSLPEVIKDAFLADVITAGHAEKLAKLADPLKLEAFARCFFDIADSDVLKVAKSGHWDDLRNWVASPASLQSWIDEHTRLDIHDPEQQDRLPGLAEVAAAAKSPNDQPAVVEISRDWSLSPKERKALPGVLERSSYTEIPGSSYNKNPDCPSAERALVVHGGRPQFQRICRDKECPVHHPKPKAIERESSSRGKSPAPRKLSTYELQEQKRQKQQAAFARVKGAAFRAMAPTLLKASVSAAFVRDMVGGFQIPEISKKFGIALSDKTAVAVLIASHLLSEGWQRTRVVRIAKLVGFNFEKFERDEAKKSKASKLAKAKKPAKAVSAKKAKKGKAA